jgi:hypothetical protein
MFLLKYVLNCEHISIRINCNRISEGLLYMFRTHTVIFRFFYVSLLVGAMYCSLVE